MPYAAPVRVLGSRLVLSAALGAAVMGCSSARAPGGIGAASGGAVGTGVGGTKGAAGSNGSAGASPAGGSGGSGGTASGGGATGSGGATVIVGASADAGNDAAQGASGDAGPDVDASSPVTASALESIALPASGTSVPFKTSLAQGSLYLLKASGSVAIGGQTQDAEFASTTGASDAVDVVNGTDVGIDIGVLQIHAPLGTKQVAPGPGRMKWFGSFRSDHTYYMTVTGAGNALAPKLVTAGSGASGTLAVSIFLLAPPPPATNMPTPGTMPPPPAPPNIGRSALEVLQVPDLKTTVKSMLTGDSNTVYLLQASGAARAGGGGLKMGDADYDDWTATGSGANNNDGACDFGIGVDESDICAGPRLRWWGPYRNDHVYYMLYASTGSPISFLYFDSAYGDNSATDTLTMSIFPVP